MSGLVRKGMPGKSLPVITPITPGSALALLVSIFRMRAWARTAEYLTVQHAGGRQVGSITGCPRSLHPGVLSFDGLPYDLVVLHNTSQSIFGTYAALLAYPPQMRDRFIATRSPSCRSVSNPSTQTEEGAPIHLDLPALVKRRPVRHEDLHGVGRAARDLIQKFRQTDVPVEIDRPQVRVSEEHEVRIECYGHVCECLFLQSALNVRARSLRCRQSRACGRASGRLAELRLDKGPVLRVEAIGLQGSH